MVGLLEQNHRGGRRFETVEFIEEGRRVAVGLKVSDTRWGDESALVFKVFTFAGPEDHAVLLQDCADREDALAHLAAG